MTAGLRCGRRGASREGQGYRRSRGHSQVPGPSAAQPLLAGKRRSMRAFSLTDCTVYCIYVALSRCGDIKFCVYNRQSASRVYTLKWYQTSADRCA